MEDTPLHKRIFQRKEALGLDRGSFVALSGLARTRVDEIDAGARMSASEYERLCRAVAIDPTALYRGEGDSERRTPIRFRAATAVDQPDGRDVRLLALAAEAGRVLSHLLTLLNKEVVIAEHRTVEPVPEAQTIWKHAYSLGEAARANLGLEDGRIRDLDALLRSLTIHVARVGLSSPDVDAACVYEPGSVPVILLNSRSRTADHPGAVRASMAHELCHVLHDATPRGLTTSVSWGRKETGNYGEATEIRARAFAPAFLAPRPAVNAWASGLGASVRDRPKRLVRTLAEYWGLSYEGAAWHAKNCRLIEPETAERLANRTKKPAVSYDMFQTPEFMAPPSMLDPSLPDAPAPMWDGLAGLIILEALEEGHISAGRARELLTWK